jgi:hypothetical protein
MASITDNPEAFFDELTKPTEEKPSVSVVPEAKAPKTEKTADITADPVAFFDALTPARAKESPKETLQSLFLSQVADKKPEQFDEYDWQSLNELAPEDLSGVNRQRKDLPLNDEQLRRVYEHNRKQEEFKAPESFGEFVQMAGKAGIGLGDIAMDVGHTLWNATKGAGALAYRAADYLSSDLERATTPAELEAKKKLKEEKWKPLEQGIYSALAPVVQMPEELAWTGSKIAEGGTDWSDRLAELIGLQDREKSFQHFKNRNAIEAGEAMYFREHPTIYGRLLDNPILQNAVSSVVKHDMPTADEWLKAYPDLTKDSAGNPIPQEEALKKAQAIIDLKAQQFVADAAKEEEKKIPEIDPNIALAGTFLAPEGLGMGEMGYLTMGLKAGGELAPRIAQGFRYLGKTDEEIKAINDGLQQIEKDRIARKVQNAQQPSIVGQVAGGLDTAITNVGDYLSENTPEAIKKLAPYVAGAALGYETADPEHRLKGITLGALGGKLGTELAGPLAKPLAKAVLKAPALIKEVDEARRIAAGGSVGTFETLAGVPDVSEGAAKLLRLGGKRIDNVLGNAVDYAKAGIAPTAIAIATGALDSADPETMRDLISQGLIFGIGGHAAEHIKGKITGSDHIGNARRRAEEAVDAFKTYSDMTPEARNTLNDITSWDRVTERQQKLATDAFNEYQDAINKGKNEKEVARLGNEYEAQQKALSAVMRANVQTRNEFGRLFVNQLSKNNQLVNGTLRAGQNNVGTHILTSKQIFDHMRQDPANANLSDEYLKGVAQQQGFYSTPSGAIEYPAGVTLEDKPNSAVFDKTKPSIVINADTLNARMQLLGETPIDALNHEFGHHIANIPEFKEANKDAAAMLFSQEVKDPAGRVVTTTSGLYSPKKLVEMYQNDYLRNKTPEQIKAFAEMAGHWDRVNDRLNEDAVAKYMQEEILADLNAETLSRHLGKDLTSGALHVLDMARLKTKKNLLDRAVEKFLGLGGSGDIVNPNTGAKFSPEVMAANRQAMRALRSLQGEVSPAIRTQEAPKISRAEMMRNKAILGRYGKYSGLFKTEMKAQIFDRDGNPVGDAVTITNPAAAEGSWKAEGDQVRQTSGYGQRPDEVAGVQIPDGGTLVVNREFVTQADGVTPVMYTPKEAKALQKSRINLIRDALNTPDQGYPNRFEPVADDSETWRGTFSPMQIQAIKNMPEGLVPRSIKDHLLQLNDIIVRNDGTRFLVDYAAVMNDAGKYTAYSPKHYDIVPIGMHMSKDGNFLVTTISVGRMFDKLNKWSERMPARLALWNGSKEAFFKEFTDKYLKNWAYRELDERGREKYPRGLAGETDLDPDPNIAKQKKDIFNDFLNLTRNDLRGSNLDRTRTPRMKGDVRGKDIDRTIMSMRLDHIAELIENEKAPKVRVDYGNAISNFLPKPAEEQVAPAPREEERTAVHPEIQKALEAVKQVAPTAGYQPSEGEEERITDATYTNPRTGEVSRGASHLQANPNAPQEATDRESPAYGFATTSGRIVDRNEAYRIAQAAGQLKAPANEEEKFHADRGVLHSGMYEPAGKGDISFMPSRELDEAHAKAIESGDTEEAQRLVDEAARKAGYAIGPVYHGTNDAFPFTIPKGHRGVAAHMTFDKELAEPWAKDAANRENDIRLEEAEGGAYEPSEPVLRKWYAKGEIFDQLNELHLDRVKQGSIPLDKSEWNHADYELFERSDVQKAIKDAGFAGYMDREGYGDDWGKSIAIFDPNNIKSADPATYDDNGKLIPLSQRFDTSKQDIRYLPAKTKPTVTPEGHVLAPEDLSTSFKATPQILANFLPASQRVDLSEYADYPMFALPADRMGVGVKFVGPTDKKKKLSVEAQGGPEHIMLPGGGWAFSGQGPATTFVRRVDQLADENNKDSVLVAITLQSRLNHLKNQTGQLAYVEAMKQAQQEGMFSKKRLNDHIKEIAKSISSSSDKDIKEATIKKWGSIKNFEQFENAVRSKILDFGDTAPFLVQLQRKRLPISTKELSSMGLMPEDIARNLSTDWIFDLPDYSVIGLFEVPKGSTPVKDNVHYSYPWKVPGRPIGFLKNIYPVKALTSNPSIQKATTLSQPLQMILPQLDTVKKALSELKPIMTYQ